MTEKLLVPLDGSELSHRILALVRRIAVAAPCEVLLARVLGRDELDRDDGRDDATDLARGDLAHAASILESAGIKSTSVVLSGDPASEILDLAASERPGLITLASHGRTGLARWIRGSTAERILRGSKSPVLVANTIGLEPDLWRAPEGSRDLERELSFKKILVPLDGSDLSLEVLPHAADLARRFGSSLTLLHVTEPGRRAPFDWLEQAARSIEGVPVEARFASGSPAAAIVDVATSELFDLVAMTTHGRTGLARWAVGSVAENVLRACPAPLLVVRTQHAFPASQRDRRESATVI